MMNTKRVIHVCVIAALALMGASATAGQPFGQGAAAPSKPAVKPARRHCVAAPAASGYGDSQPSSGYAAKVRALPTYVQDLMRDPDRADLNGATDPCRLDNNDPDEDEATNDGVDKHKLLDQIDSWMALNSRSFTDDAHDLDWQNQQVRLEFEDADHRMHAYVGYSRIEDDRAMRQQPLWQPLAWYDHGAANGALGPLHDVVGKGDQQNILNNNTQPVPEPGAWAMLLAGLVTVGVVLRRRIS